MKSSKLKERGKLGKYDSFSRTMEKVMKADDDKDGERGRTMGIESNKAKL